ncbi:unnamed protein product, partial [Owenia fusiformis]
IIIMATAPPVQVSVEPVIENQIQEVTLDGQEIYIQPLSMSESLTKLAQKIDFGEDTTGSGVKRQTSEIEGEEKEEEKTSAFQQPTWPWDSVRTKLKAALTEMNVLLDILNIAKEKRYMVLDPVQQEPQEQKIGGYLQAKKKSLQTVSEILCSGAERLQRSQGELTRTQQDFHLELLRLRQSWRLKKTGQTILGDLSYKSAGSRFWHTGTFEVKKADQTSAGDHMVKPFSALEVSVPSELQGVAYVQVSIQNTQDSSNIAVADLSIPSTLVDSMSKTDTHWKTRLESAQMVIFCKEVFAQLAREAVQMKTAVPHMVVGNQIIARLFPGYQLSIALCHYTGKEKNITLSSAQNTEHNHVLEHSLHQLLCEVHYKNLHHPAPHPVTSTLGMSKRRRLAGPHGYSTEQLLELSDSKTILEQIINQAKHVILRNRATKLLDSVIKSIPDPTISAHWACLGTPTETSVKITITSPGYENVRTSFTLTVGIDEFKAIGKDGRIFTMSSEEQELKDLILCQISNHHISLVQTLSKMMGWQVLSCNTHSGVGNLEPVGSPSTITLASPNGDSVVAVHSGAISGVKVSVSLSPQQEESTSNSTLDKKWTNLAGPYKDVVLEKQEGKSIMNKIELLLAALVAS